jgi:hypothetical protein
MLGVQISEIRVADPYPFKADPDPTFHFNVDRDPDPAIHQSVAMATGLQTLHASILSLYSF